MMKISDREIERRLMALETAHKEEKKALGERIRIVYTDGHAEEVRETQRVKVKEVEAATDWFAYVDGYSNRVPDIQRVEYLESGKVWDFEKEARKPPLSEEEIKAIINEIEEKVMKKEGRI